MEPEAQCYCGRGNPLTKEVPFLEEAVLGRKTHDVYYTMLTGFFGAEAVPDDKLLREPTGEDIYYFLPARHPLSHSTNHSSFFCRTTLLLLSAGMRPHPSQEWDTWLRLASRIVRSLQPPWWSLWVSLGPGQWVAQFWVPDSSGSLTWRTLGTPRGPSPDVLNLQIWGWSRASIFLIRSLRNRAD